MEPLACILHQMLAPSHRAQVLSPRRAMRSDFVEQYNGSNEPVPLNSMSRKRYRIVILCMVWLQLTLLCMLFCNQAFTSL